jgi:osomolarity two-component system sensor histidine kinase NIK1
VENCGSLRSLVADLNSTLLFNGKLSNTLISHSTAKLTFHNPLSRIGEWNLDQVRQRTLIPHPGRRILFIDTLRHDPSISEAVEQLGLEITVVDAIEEAVLLDQAQSGYFDTVLVDQLTVVEKLRDVEHLRYIPLVLITPHGHVTQLNLKYCLDFGIANCVESPTNAQDMCNALLPALEASNRIPSERGGETTFKLLLAEDS